MKNVRLLGSMIEKLANANQCTTSDISHMLDCTEEQVWAIYSGRMLPSFSQLEKLASCFKTTIDALLAGDEAYYNDNVVHCMGQFENNDNREMILDIIDDYLSLCSAVSNA